MWNRFSGNGGSKTASRGLRAVDDLTAAVLATLSDHVAIVDRDGNVIAVNKAWKSYDCECGDHGLPRSDVGSNYLEACESAEQAGAGGFEGAALGLRAVLGGSRSHFALTYLCHSPSGQRWFRMTATPTGSPSDGAVISHAAVGEPTLAGEAPLATAIASAETGEPLLRAWTEHVAKTIGARFAFLSEVVDERCERLRLVALWSGEGFEESFEYEVKGTPCRDVLRGELCFYAAEVQESFPDDAWLKEIAAHCYLGLPLFSAAGEVIGHLGVIHDQALDNFSFAEHVLRAVATQAGPELDRMRLLKALQKSERTGRALLNAAGDSAVLLETDGTITDLNEAAAIRAGTTVEEALGRNLFDMLSPEQEAPQRAAIAKVLTSRGPLHTEFEEAGRTFESSIYPVLDEQGNVERVAIFARNITARKTAEEQLAKSEEKTRLIVDTITHGVEEIDLSGVITFANEAYHRIFEYENGELIGASMLELAVSEHDRAALRDYLAFVAKEEPSPALMTAKKKTKSGRIIDVEVAWDYARDDDGRVTGLVAVITDVTDRKLAEAQLRESEEKFRMLAENVAEVFWLIDPENYQVLYANPSYEKLWGRTCESLYEDPRSWLAAVHPEEIERVTAALEKQAETGEFEEEFRIIRPDGSIRWVWDRGYSIKDESGQVQHMVGVAADITDRKLTEEALAQSERRLRQVTEHISEIVWLNDPVEGRLLYVSPAYEAIWGRSCQSLFDDPRSWLKAVHPDDLELVKAEFGRPEEGFDQEYRIIRPDGSVRWIWDRGFTIREDGDGPLRMVGITADITERKQVEEELALQARVLENMSEGVNVCDENAKILVTNPTFDEMFGYERGELIDQHASVLNAGSIKENQRVFEEIMGQLEEVGSWRGEINSKRKDGTKFITSARISTLEVSGKTYLINVREDITERKREAEALRQSAERNAALLEAIPDMMFTLDRRGVYLDFVTAQGQEPYISPDEFLGRTVSEVLPAALALDIMQSVELALDTGRQQELAYELDVDDEKHEYEARILKSKEDQALAIVRDVTATKRLEREEQLRKARDELEGTVEKAMLGRNPYGLTFREFTVLHLAADGEADKAIADQLGISTFTVSKHVANILGKMAAASRTEACVRALREGLLT